MKAIELTEEHKSKLLEMCKALFPKTPAFRTDGEFFIYFEDKNKNIVIHWFEFCMTHLSEKLVVDYGASYYEMTHNYNPVDYLYEHFKKLKP